MNDLLSLYDVLALPSGAQLVSDRGAVTLLVMSHDGPNKLTLERVPLGAAVSVEQLLAALAERGLLPAAPVAAPLPEPEPERVEPQPADEPPAPKKRSGPPKGFKHERVTCERCGTVVPRNNVVQHNRACQERPVEPSAPAEPEPDPVAPSCAGCGVLFGPDRVEKAPYAVVNGQAKCETCVTGSVYGRRAAA